MDGKADVRRLVYAYGGEVVIYINNFAAFEEWNFTISFNF